MGLGMDRRTPRITDVFDEVRRLDETIAVMSGDAPRREPSARTAHTGPDAPTAPVGSSSSSETGSVVGAHWLMAFLRRLEKRVAALEAELPPRRRSRRCPCCQALTLEVVAIGPHPEFGFAGIEQREVRCGSPKCGYRGNRLHDPNDYIC